MHLLFTTFSPLSVHDFRTYVWTHFVSKKERNLWHPGPRGDSLQCAWGHPKRKWPYKNAWALQPQQGLPPSPARLHNLHCYLFRKYSYLMDFCFFLVTPLKLINGFDLFVFRTEDTSQWMAHWTTTVMTRMRTGLLWPWRESHTWAPGTLTE